MISDRVSFASSLMKPFKETMLTNLSKRRPWIRPKKPIRRPSTTARRHVLDISNEQAMRIPIVTDQTNSRPPPPTQREFVGSIDAQPSGAVRSRGVSIPFGRGSVDILDVPAGGIATREEVELVEEARSRVVVDELIRRDSRCSVSVAESAIGSALRRYKGKK